MSQITVTNIQGQTSGGNANKVIITSGHTLEVTSNSTVGGNSTITGSLTAPDIRATAIKSPTGNASTTIANDGKVTFNSSVEQSGSTLPQLGMFKILDATIGSAVAAYNIDSTYINSTYNTYHLYANLHPSGDGPDLLGRFIVGGSVDTGTNYGYEGNPADGGAHFTSDSSSSLRFNRYGIGNDTGEGISIFGVMTNVNSTVFPCGLVGAANSYGTGGHHFYNDFGTAYKSSSASNVVNGLSLFFDSSSNIEFGNIQLYGIK